jgi:hypothetical protein
MHQTVLRPDFILKLQLQIKLQLSMKNRTHSVNNQVNVHCPDTKN